MRRVLVPVACVLAGALLGAFVVRGSDTSAADGVASKLIEHRQADGFQPLQAACHRRPDVPDDYLCEVREAILPGPATTGYEMYVVRGRARHMRFERITRR